MKIVFKFTLNNKEYCLYLENNNTRFGYIVNDIIYNNLSNDEINLIKSIILVVSSNTDLIYFHDTIVNNNKYSIYIDKKTHLKTFMPNLKEEDLIYLNKFYNNLYNPVMYLNKISDSEHKYYSYLYTFLGISIVLCINLSVDFIRYCNQYSEVLSNGVDYKNDLKINSYNIDKNSSDEKIISKIKEVLDNNINLSNEEKEMILCNPNSILDNKEYINFDDFLTKLSLLDIKYVETTPNEDELWAAYTNNALIVIGYSKDFKSTNKSVFTHEISHLYSSYDRNLRSSILEPLNCMFNSKYFNDDDNYYYCINNFKILSRIIGSEKLKICQFTGGDDLIINELNKIIPDYDKANKVLEYMEEYKSLCEEQTKLFANEEYNYVNKMIVLSTRMNEIQNEINNLFSEYYYKKYNLNIEDDVLINNGKKNIYGPSGNMYSTDEMKIRNYIISKYNTPEINTLRCTYGYELNIPNDINVFEDDNMIYAKKIIYVFDGYDKDYNIVYKKVLGEKETLCNINDIKKSDYINYDARYYDNYLGTSINNEFSASHFGAVKKILPSEITDNWNLVYSDVVVTDNDVVDYLMNIIQDENKACLFVKAKDNNFMDDYFEELCSEYYNAIYENDMYSDNYMLCVFEPSKIEDLIRNNYNLSNYDDVYIRYDNDSDDFIISIIDNTNYHEYTTEYGDKVMGISIDNISNIKLSDLHINLGRNL